MIKVVERWREKGREEKEEKDDGQKLECLYGDEAEKREVERHETLGRVPYDGGADSL